MADEIRCPNCGHLNPPGEAQCQSCQEPLHVDPFSAVPAEEGTLPDWLSDLQGAGDLAEGDAAQEPAEQAFDSAETPDWLAGLSAPGEAADLDVSDADGEPDWLSDLLEGQDAGTVPAETPDWLTGDGSTTPPFEAEAPDWLATPASQPAAQEDAPDWLTAPAEAETPAAEQPSAFLAGLPEEEPAAAQDASPPDWLEDLSKHPAERASANAPAFVMDDEPAKVPENADDFLTTLPDWVSQVSAEDLGAEDAGADGEPGLLPSDLPTWLEAMRPVESAAPSATPFEDVSSADVVASGPLAGLRGVLMAEPDVALSHKPPAYSVKLRVTDEQKARVRMLEQLLASEDQPKPAAAAPVVSPQFIFRLVIALALILPILWMRITGAASLSAPAANNLPGVNELRTQVASLPNGAAVLVAFDYEPGFSGEMEAAASAVLAHLMQRDAYLVLVSTSPTGPVLAQGLLDELNNQPEPGQNSDSRYVNMGYVPGGAAGLLGLAQSPSLAMPYSLLAEQVWEQPPLNQVKSAADFALLLVITDDPNTARAWIEQVGPVLAEQDTPLLMVTSAQAEPLVRPYTAGANPQVQGLVSGLAGGAAYEAAQGGSQTARGMWDAFGVGMLVAVLIILAGSLLFRLLESRPSQPAQKEK